MPAATIRRSAAGSTGAAALQLPDEVAALFSCAAGERALESDKYAHGVFFYHILQGLQGAAADSDGEVTWLSLTDYVTKRVPMDVARLHGGRVSQTPSLRSGEMMGASPVLARKAKQVKGTLVFFFRGDEDRVLAEHQHQVPPSQPWVTFVVPGCGGDRLGLKAGDLLLQVDGWEVATVVESEAAINNREPGSRIELTVERAGQRLTLSGPYETVLTDSQIISRIRRLADRGDVEAQFALAISLATGQFAVKDDSEAVAWFRKAADQGLARAQNSLGGMYDDRPRRGQGRRPGRRLGSQGRRPGTRRRAEQPRRDVREWPRRGQGRRPGRRLVSQGRRPGHADAQYNLGWMYAMAAAWPRTTPRPSPGIARPPTRDSPAQTASA